MTILSNSINKQRKWDVIFFIPALSFNVNYKIGKQCLNLITKAFDRNNPYKRYLIAVQLKYQTAAQAISKAKC